MIRSTSSRLLGLLAVVILLAACAPSTGALGSPSTPEPSADESVAVPSDDATPDLTSPSTTPSSAPSTASPSSTSGSPAPATASPRPTPTATARHSTSPSGTVIVRAYFVMGSFTGNEGLVPVLRELASTKAVATAAVRALLEGPNEAEMAGSPAMYTAIPAGTTLLGISIADGVATVNLSKEFERGGGSATTLARLAQVVYTLTQFPTVTGVLFELDGAPVTVFGSEGVVLDGPVDRVTYHDQLPAIFVDGPAWGASIGNPATVRGLANVFEATFQLELRDGAGKVVAHTTVNASCGTGCWGDWKASLGYTVPKAQWGTLRVYDLSAKDGAVENRTDYRVWLTPAP